MMRRLAVVGDALRPHAARRSFSSVFGDIPDYVKIVEVGPRDGLQVCAAWGAPSAVVSRFG
jgi:hypothetical protein